MSAGAQKVGTLADPEAYTAAPADEAPTGRLAELYVRYAPDGLRLAYLLTGDHALAEDLVQEAFARVVGKLGHLREKDAFHAYLRRTIVNLSKNHFRHRAVERAYLERYGPAERALASAAEPTAGNVVEHEAMRKALLGLPPRQRAALVLRFYEDMPQDQIAVILRCREGTARSLVSRGVQALRNSSEVRDHA